MRVVNLINQLSWRNSKLHKINLQIETDNPVQILYCLDIRKIALNKKNGDDPILVPVEDTNILYTDAIREWRRRRANIKLNIETISDPNFNYGWRTLQYVSLEPDIKGLPAIEVFCQTAYITEVNKLSAEIDKLNPYLDSRKDDENENENHSQEQDASRKEILRRQVPKNIKRGKKANK